MNVVGIIAEYNPFHEGHAYQIQKAKEQCGAEFAVVEMNGDFVQRGEPAIFDKYTRTKEALLGGADLIFELPVRFGLSSAGDFAMGGVLALNALPFITHLCFGTETGDLTPLLQGSVAGLNITTSSGKPGSTPAINIRGVNSINSADPLVLIDGVVGDLNRVNPNDVESISVIKDASAAAVYGARAAFGVILVTTKNGSAQDGKATVRYSGRFGWEEATTSTDYENRGYWSVYTVNKFWQADSGTNYVKYNDHDMQQLLARVNDRTGCIYGQKYPYRSQHK